MSRKQPHIPGLESPAAPEKAKQPHRDRVSQLQDRVLKLELEVSLLRILVENPKKE
jgi:hypothetical protein